MDGKEIKFSSKKEQSIKMITGTTYSGTSSPNRPKPIVIFHDNLPIKDKTSKAPRPVLVVEVPRPFLYKSNKIVSCDYHYNYTNEAAIVDLTGVGGITRSRRYLLATKNKVTPEKPLIQAYVAYNIFVEGID